jgi:hypothetical protein
MIQLILQYDSSTWEWNLPSYHILVYSSILSIRPTPLIRYHLIFHCIMNEVGIGTGTMKKVKV